MDREENEPLVSSKVTLVFILLNALVWLAFGVITAFDAHPAVPESDLIRWMMATLALLNSGVLIVLSILLRKGSCIAYYLTLGLLAVISILLIMDEFGAADLVVLFLNVVPIILLLKDRGWYLQPDEDIQESTSAT